MMAEYFIVTTKDQHGAYFQTKSKKWTRDITPVGKTTLGNQDLAYDILPEAAYYMNILANNLYKELNDYTDELKEKAKKLVGENEFVEWQNYIKMEHNEIRRLQKEFLDVYPLE